MNVLPHLHILLPLVTFRQRNTQNTIQTGIQNLVYGMNYGARLFKCTDMGVIPSLTPYVTFPRAICPLMSMSTPFTRKPRIQPTKPSLWSTAAPTVSGLVKSINRVISSCCSSCTTSGKLSTRSQVCFLFLSTCTVCQISLSRPLMVLYSSTWIPLPTL